MEKADQKALQKFIRGYALDIVKAYAKGALMLSAMIVVLSVVIRGFDFLALYFGGLAFLSVMMIGVIQSFWTYFRGSRTIKKNQ